MNLVAAIRDMLAKGLPVEQALAAAELIEAHEEAERKARKARKRARLAVIRRDNVVQFPGPRR
jgi:hypothetical protein